MQQLGIDRARAGSGLGLLEFVGVAHRQRADVEEAGAGLLERDRGLGSAEPVDRKAILANALGEGQEVAVGRHDAEAVDIAAVEQVHGVDGHPHVGRALALDDVELLHRDDRVRAGEIAPALEARLGPVAVGAADIDGSELAKDQQNLVKVLRGRVIGVDQQCDIGFRVDIPLAHRDSFSTLYRSGAE